MKSDFVRNLLKTVFVLCSIALGVYLVWHFFYLLFYIISALIISIVGRPMVTILNKVKIGKIKIPNALSTTIALILIIAVFALFIAFIIPHIANQAVLISQIKSSTIENAFSEHIHKLEYYLHKNKILSVKMTLNDFIFDKLKSFFNFTTISSLLNGVLRVTGNLSMAIFSIFFISFFFIKDSRLFYRIFLSIIPSKYKGNGEKVLKDVKILLTRYFVGLLIELVSMMTLISVGLVIFGIPNALFIGIIGGFMNIIPYLGPIIGAVIGVIIGITNCLSIGDFNNLLITTGEIIMVFSIANVIDNILLQPIIYSNSVKAHPLEIFIVIIMAGNLFGIVGMVLAIPGYTLFRVILREFFSEFEIVRKITRGISKVEKKTS